jgi:hypothetical protein
MIPYTNLWADDISIEGKTQWALQNQHICLNPYTTLHSQVVPGQIQSTCCCNLKPSEINDRQFTELKTTIEQGVKNNKCQLCYKSEEQIGTSERTLTLIRQPPQLINQFLTTGTVDHFEFRIKFSNLCNLACKTCQPEFSSKYAQMYNIRVLKEFQDDISTDQTFWNTITTEIADKCQAIPNVSIALLGGESLIQPGAIRLLNWLADNNLSKQIDLRITTNFTNLKDNIIKLFDGFRAVTVCASIDSVNENYSYVRYPETFDTIKNNLSFVLANRNIRFSITPVWSLHNIFYMVDYLDWWHTWFTEHNIYNINISNVSMSEPHIMTIQNLPVEYRPHLLTIINQAAAHDIFKNPRHASLHKYLEGIIKFLSSDTVVYDKFIEFLKQTALDDCTTNMSMTVGNNRLYNILSKQHKQYLNT